MKTADSELLKVLDFFDKWFKNPQPANFIAKTCKLPYGKDVSDILDCARRTIDGINRLFNTNDHYEVIEEFMGNDMHNWRAKYKGEYIAYSTSKVGAKLHCYEHNQKMNLEAVLTFFD